MIPGKVLIRVLFLAWKPGGGASRGKIVDGLPAVGADWLAQVFAPEPGHPDQSSIITYRFRYYSAVNGDPHTGSDEKAGTTAQSPFPDPKGTKSEEMAREMFRSMIFMEPGSVQVADDVTVVDGDVGAALKGRPWAHFREVPPPELDN